MPTKPKQAAPLSREDEVLWHMLNTPHKDHAPKPAPAKKATRKKAGK